MKSPKIATDTSLLCNKLQKLPKNDRVLINRFKQALLRKYGTASEAWKPLIDEAISKMISLRSSSNDPVAIFFDPASGTIQLQKEGARLMPHESQANQSSDSKNTIGVFPSIQFSGCC
jgi:hypothetical protein